MARSTRTHVGPDSIPSVGSAFTPKHLTKQEFGRRIYELINERGWSQSDLARAADLPRDSISTYVNGKSLPQGKSLKKLAEAFGLRPLDLLPNETEAAIDADFPAFEMKISPSAPQMAWVRINRAMPTPIALKIAGLIGEADNDVAD
jgi:transcriptional regulator with XRE-family HTH domain